MRPLTYIELGAAALVVVVGIVALHEHDAHIREEAVSEAVQKAQGDYQKQLQKLNDDVEAKLKTRDEQTAQVVKGYQDELAKLKTPQQQVTWSQDQLKDTIKGVMFEYNAKTGETIARIPAASLPSLPQAIEQCKECTTKLAGAQADAADRAVQMGNAQKEIDSLKKENKGLADEVKGGSWIKRTGRALLVAACAGGGGYAASPRGATAAGIGAAAGAVVCTIATRR